MLHSQRLKIGVAIATIMLGLLRGASAAEYFAIRVVDQETRRGVPLVELRTVNDISFWTDSAGYVAFGEPSFFGKQVFFHVASHGYEHSADGFGYRGVRLSVEAGLEAVIQLRRTNVAERLYRVTGEGIYRDSVLLGKQTPIAAPLLNAGVLGSDSVLTAVYRKKIRWFWGDTNFANYPLGNFHVPGATSLPPSSGGLDPSVGVDLTYFPDDLGNAKPTCKMPGEGPTWIFGLTVVGADMDLKSGTSHEAMLAGYAKIKPPLEVYERGVVRWDDASNEFIGATVFPEDAQAYPMGHPVISEHDGIKHVYYCDPLPLVRVIASEQSILDPAAYEVYSCVASGTGASEMRLDRDDDGQLVWKWRRASPRMTRELEDRLVRDGKLHGDERVFRLATAGSDRRWTLHTASIAWSDYRDRWIMIGLEVGGESSFLGEVYYSEADDLVGPWSPATKIVSHDGYTFYNPRLHPMFTSEDGRSVYFEGTYTKTFSKAAEATPRYDYNQVMYRLDLDRVAQ